MNSQKVYRFCSIYELYDLIARGRLRWSKLATFEDKNEGVGELIKFRDNIITRHNFRTKDIVEASVRSTQHNNYVSCWSSKPDQIAMWAIYSPDKNSIRISSTIEKINEATKLAKEKYDLKKEMNSPGSRKLVCYMSFVRSVDYVDFIEFRDKADARYKEYDEKLDREYQENPDYLKSEEFNELMNEYQSNWQFIHDEVFLKDEAYSHEHEIRMHLKCGVRGNVTVEEQKADYDPRKNFWTTAAENELPSYLFSDTSSEFIESICFDPRMPEFKHEIIASILGDDCPPIVESQAFGRILDTEDFTVDYP